MSRDEWPNSPDHECDLIGAALRSVGQCDDLLARVEADDFFSDFRAECWRSIRDLRDNGAGVEPMHLHDEMVRRGRLDRYDVDTLAGVIERAGSGAFADRSAAIVRGLAQRRRLIQACERIADECRIEHDAETTDLIDRAEREVFAVAEREVSGSAVPAYQAIDAAIAKIERRKRGEFGGVATGLTALDETTDGLHPKQLAILAARPSIGKTAVALNICEHVALECRRPVLFVSLEMDRGELGERLAASRARVDGRKIKAGLVTDEEMARVHRARHEYLAAPLIFDDHPTRSASQIAALARRHKHRDGLALLVVDYLQLIDSPQAKGESRQEAVARVGRRLKVMARELDVPVLAMAQLNRESEKREDKKPRLSELRESGALEQDADIVMLLHRPAFYDKNDRPGQADIIIAKNRSGGTGTARLAFHDGFVRFEDLPQLIDGPF